MKEHRKVVWGILILMAAGSVFSGNVRWNRVWEDDSWLNTNNWDTGVIPGSDDKAFIDRAEVVKLYGNNVTVQELYISGNRGNAGELIVNDDESIRVNHLKVASYSGDAGVLAVLGGAVYVGGWLKISEAAGASGHVELSGGSITVGTLSFDEDAADFGGTLNITGGVLYLDGDDAATAQAYVDDGHITGYGSSNVSVVYDPYQLKTIVKAVKK